MTPQSFIQWADSEIEICNRLLEKETNENTRTYLSGRRTALRDAKNQHSFIELTQSIDTQLTEPNNFTDGLE